MIFLPDLPNYFEISMPQEETIELKSTVESDGVSKEKKVDSEANDAGKPASGKPNFSRVDKKVLAIIPEESARKYGMAAVRKERGLVDVVMVDPRNIDALNVLRFLAKQNNIRFSVLLVSQEELETVLRQYGSAESALKSAIKTLESKDPDNLQAQMENEFEEMNSYQDAPVAKLVETIVQHAIDGGASDVHIEPIENEYRVRFRVDGILHSSLILPKQVGKAVVSRVKILANLKIDEKRKPQDGRFRLEQSGSSVDFRISSLPVIEGEKVVMRVLDKDSGLANLTELGLLGPSSDVFNRCIRFPYGIILITGPTGSGKSTTLYGFLKVLNTEETNIITLEDPVEYFIEGLNQSQIKPEIGYSFANGLRSILRQDPNVIMVGEIRDSETAELSIHAALTGHLVFSTLHTNDALGAASRLIDMGVEGFLLSASLRAVAAQRLVRRVCQTCKETTDVPESVMVRVREMLSNVPPEDVKKYGIMDLKTMRFVRGKGCDECGNTGYKGRIAIYEIIALSSEMKEIIADSKNVDARLRDQARKEGAITMKQDGILKAILGLTTLDEIERVTEGKFIVASADGEEDEQIV